MDEDHKRGGQRDWKQARSFGTLCLAGSAARQRAAVQHSRGLAPHAARLGAAWLKPCLLCSAPRLMRFAAAPPAPGVLQRPRADRPGPGGRLGVGRPRRRRPGRRAARPGCRSCAAADCAECRLPGLLCLLLRRHVELGAGPAQVGGCCCAGFQGCWRRAVGRGWRHTRGWVQHGRGPCLSALDKRALLPSLLASPPFSAPSNLFVL